MFDRCFIYQIVHLDISTSFLAHTMLTFCSCERFAN